jgi:sensor c-di-GMP phosphodiesterase-like protein
MPGILPVEMNRTTARAQFLAKLVLPRAKEPAMTPLREIIEHAFNALFQPIIDLKSGEFIGFEG